MPAWRLVIGKVATLAEIDTHWSLDDMLDANAVLDMQDHGQWLEQKKAERK